MLSSLTTVHSSALGFSPFPPVSVSGTDTPNPPREAFLGSMGSVSYPASKELGPHHFSVSALNRSRVFILRDPPTSLNRDIHHPAGLPFSVPPREITDLAWYRNVSLFSITYGFRPRLRIRLTLGGLTCPRKPWDFGEQVSHLFSRYSCWHNHS